MSSEVGSMSPATMPSRAAALRMAGDAALFSAVTIFAGPLALIIGPAASWLLHGRRVSRTAAIGLALGVVGGLAVVGGVLGVLVGIGWAIGPLGGSEFGYPIALLAIASAISLAGLVALDVDAIRDLSPSRRTHRRLDIARLAATVALAVGVAAITVIQTKDPASEIGDAGVFALASGAVAAVAMLVAQRVCARLERRQAASGDRST